LSSVTFFNQSKFVSLSVNNLKNCALSIPAYNFDAGDFDDEEEYEEMEEMEYAGPDEDQVYLPNRN
jgi:hypothetical protein